MCSKVNLIISEKTAAPKGQRSFLLSTLFLFCPMVRLCPSLICYVINSETVAAEIIRVLLRVASGFIALHVVCQKDKGAYTTLRLLQASYHVPSCSHYFSAA